MTIKNQDHLRMANTETGGYALICLHCGDIYVPSLPISIDMFLDISKRFGKQHKNCRCPGNGPLDENALLAKAGIRHLSNITR